MNMDDDRYDFLNDRIDHVDDRVTALEGDREVKRSRTLEYIVIAIITVETIFSALLYFHHG